MNKTTIEWVRNPDGTQGFTWNPITGCLNGCTYCYARRLANGRMRRTMLNTQKWHPPHTPYEVAPGCDESDPFAPRFWSERLRQPSGYDREHRPFLTVGRQQAAKGIFVCNMGELFASWLPNEWTKQVLRAVENCDCYGHRFYLLTKQPQELAKWSPFPPNAWVGVSAWDHASFINACHYLEGVEATVRYVSLEPLLQWRVGIDVAGFARAAGLSWLIIGAQTKPSVPVPGEWIDDIVPRCHEAGVAVFLKNSLRYLVEDEHFKFELLQEFPKAVQP